MSKINDQIDKILIDFSKEVNQAILDGKFKVTERGSHTINIDVLGENISIWNENDPEHTQCYRLTETQDRNTIYFPESKFKRPATCRKLLRAETEPEAVERKRKVAAQIKDLERQLKG